MGYAAAMQLPGYTLKRRIECQRGHALYDAVHTASDQPCLLRLIDLDGLNDEGLRQRLDAEVRTLQVLSRRTPALQQVLDCGYRDGQYLIALEALPPAALPAALRGAPLLRRLHCFRQIAEALDRAHEEGVAHAQFDSPCLTLREQRVAVITGFICTGPRVPAGDAEPAWVQRYARTAGDIRAAMAADRHALGALLYDLMLDESGTLVTTSADQAAPDLERLIYDLLDQPAAEPRAIRAMLRTLAVCEQRLTQRAPARTVPLAGTELPAAGGTEIIHDDAAAGDARRLAGDSHGPVALGTVLRQRFRITDILGHGGTGTVYKAVDLLKEEARDEHTEIALKVLKPGIAEAELTFMALQREARRVQQLAHPNIVTVYDFDRADGVIYMTMEFLRGQLLDTALAEHPKGLERTRATHVAREITRGLAYAHGQGIVHADMKPDNVFLLEDGRAKLLDFGIARAYGGQHSDFVEDAFRGFTPAYASPEVLGGQKPTPADDIYALGCVIYEMFTGTHPFDHVTAYEARVKGLRPRRHPAFSRAQWSAVTRALRFSAGERPRDAEHFMRLFAPSRVRRTAVGVSTAAIAAAIALVLLYRPDPGPETPFESLPESVQVEITRNLHDADLFLDQGDLNTALQLYELVLTAHPGNPAGVNGMRRAADTALERINQARHRGDLSGAAAAAAVDSLLDYRTLPASSRRRAESLLAELRGD